LHPERYYNRKSLRYRLFYVLAAPLGCATISVAEAWKNRDSRKENFWVEVVKHVKTTERGDEVRVKHSQIARGILTMVLDH
jgi:hypothetical protein